MGVFDNLGNKLIGRQGYLDYKEAKAIKEASELKQTEFIEKTESIQNSLNKEIRCFGKYKISTLKATIGVFISYLKDIEQNNKENFYEILDSCNTSPEYIAELNQINVNLKEILTTAGTSATLAAIAVTGVPTMVTGAVASVASASTGTAISGLVGVAKTNAILAWLGGGSIASGGGGMALGSTVLATATASVTGIVALASAGLVVSSIGAKKLTSAVKYSSEVDLACAKMEVSWGVMNGIRERISEITEVTKQLYDRIINEFQYFEPLVPDFNHHHSYHIRSFQRLSLLIKSLSELAKTPLLDEEMRLTDQSEKIVIQTKKILNTEL